MRRNTGFTIIELMIVIAVIGILLSVSTPAIIRWLPNYRLKSAARDLYSNLQKAKMRAVKSNREYAVVFDTANNSYQLVSGGGDGEYDGLPVPQDDDEVEQTIDLSSYGSGVKYGHGSATKEATTPAGSFTGDAADNVSHTGNSVIFRPDGLVSHLGYIYLSNNVNDLSYAIGTPTSAGIIFLRKWSRTSWQ